MNAYVFYNVVTSAIIFALCILLYLIGINTVSRRAANNEEMSQILRTIGPTINYLLLLHVTSWITLFGILLKHTEMLTSYYTCDVVNRVVFISMTLRRFFIGLVWESRHRAVMDALSRKRSLFGRGSVIFTKVLVLAPLVVLVFTCRLTTKTEEYTNICIGDIPKMVSYIELFTILGTTLTFFILFLEQVWETCHMVSVFRADTRNLSQDLESSKYLRTSLSVKERVSMAAWRNVIVIFCSMVWLVVYDVPLNKDIKSQINTSIVTYIYRSRLVIVLDELTTDIVLYFLFRNWSFFLCNPCWGDISASLVAEGMPKSNIQPLLEDKKETLGMIKCT